MTRAGLIALALVAFAVNVPPIHAQRWQPRQPPPQGRTIEVNDGDSVIIGGDDRVAIMRRRQAEVRVVALPDARAVLVIADWQSQEAPDTGVNRTWRFTGVAGQWPFEPRWQGAATLIEAEPASRRGPTALILDTAQGVVRFEGGPAPREPLGAAGTVIHFSGMSGGGRTGHSFDDAERDAMSQSFAPSFSSSTIEFAPGGTWGAAIGSTVLAPAAPMADGSSRQAVAATQGRMPGGMPIPVLRRVEPAWPSADAMPGLRGIVVVQVAVAPDGSVRDATVVRSLPPIDQAILAAVRQWRFAPAGPEGREDPTVVVATFPFPPASR